MSIALTLGVLAFLYLLPLLLGLLVLRFGQTNKVPQFAEVDPTWLDASWVSRAQLAIDQLQQVGFVLRNYVDGMAPRDAPMGIRCAAVLVNESTGDVAQVAIADKLGTNGKPETVTIVMLSMTVGPKRVATMNGDMPGLFVRPKTHIGTALPMLHNADTLYRAHRTLCIKHAGKDTRGQLPAKGDEAKHLIREAEQEFAYQAMRGLMRPKGDRSYGLTWIGAFLGVWKLHPRFMSFHRSRMESNAHRVLAELGVTPDPIVEHEPETRNGTPLSAEAKAFVADALQSYTAAAQRLRDEWKLDQSTRMDADLAAGLVTHTFADGRLVLADMYVLGSWSRDAKSWEWAWNNPNVPDRLKPDGARVREVGARIGIAQMIEGFVPAPTIHIAAQVSALAAKALETGAVLPIPPDGDAPVVLFISLHNIRTVQPNAA